MITHPTEARQFDLRRLATPKRDAERKHPTSNRAANALARATRSMPAVLARGQEVSHVCDGNLL